MKPLLLAAAAPAQSRPAGLYAIFHTSAGDIMAETQSRGNRKYTIFGQVVDGRDIVQKVAHARVIDETPVEPVKPIVFLRVSASPRRSGGQPSKEFHVFSLSPPIP